ncbi:MAG: ABC transporter permease [Muribaculaceae bacterium]|nr:ABC transporter permease [Muribaculaceae bacterium]
MTVFSSRRARAIFSKEFKHILRDPFTLIMALLLPLLIVLILGNSIEFNIRSINLAYHDADRTETSRELIDTFGSSGYFKTYQLASPENAFDEIVAERARATLIVPPNFERDAVGGNGAGVQIMLDGADNSSVMSIMNYLQTINTKAAAHINNSYATSGGGFGFKSRYLFNPELNSRWFSVPGLTAVIIALVAIMLTTLTICREWERGSMEMLLSTPATTLEIIVGKVLPYAILSFIGFVLVFIVARIVFSVPFVGSYLTLVLGTVLFILGYLAIGLLISVSTHKQDVAIQFACIIGLLPSVILSGFIFPVEYMARIYRAAASLFPARFYIDIARDQFLKGSHIWDLQLEMAMLAIAAVVLLIICLVRFKRTLE